MHTSEIPLSTRVQEFDGKCMGCDWDLELEDSIPTYTEWHEEPSRFLSPGVNVQHKPGAQIIHRQMVFYCVYCALEAALEPSLITRGMEG